MCYKNDLSSLTTLVYLIICFALPFLYFILYLIKVKKRRKIDKVIFISIVICIVLLSGKFLAKLNRCTDCYINNNCELKKNEDDKVDKKTTTTTTTTTKVITTTTHHVEEVPGRNMKSSYPRIPVIEGEVKDIGLSGEGYKLTEVDGVTYVDGYLIVNKTYPLPSTYYPKNAHVNARDIKGYMCINCIDEVAYTAWLDMQADAKLDGIEIANRSGYRPYDCQEELYNSYVRRDGKEKADTYSARAGYSEHQSGYAFDINKASSTFNETKEAKWIHDNAYKYGYIVRFPEGKTDETGYKYESWHVRYVGTDLSYTLFQNGEYITMEKYFGLSSKYAD